MNTPLDDGFAARHQVLARGYGFRDDPDDPAAVRAMPMVLHLPKAEPPARSALLEAAAAAAVALCLDPRCGPDGPWYDELVAWTDARIRKVARRARGAQWEAAQEVPGVTVTAADVGGRTAEARAFVPGRVGDLDSRIKKLQIGGTDLEHDEPGPPDPARPVLWIDARLGMTLGKTAAQVGHASMLLAGVMTVDQAKAWAADGYRCSVRDADPARWRELIGLVESGDPTGGAVVAVRDAGFTEVAPGSMTVIATARPPA